MFNYLLMPPYSLTSSPGLFQHCLPLKYCPCLNQFRSPISEGRWLNLPRIWKRLTSHKSPSHWTFSAFPCPLIQFQTNWLVLATLTFEWGLQTESNHHTNPSSGFLIHSCTKVFYFQNHAKGLFRAICGVELGAHWRFMPLRNEDKFTW